MGEGKQKVGMVQNWELSMEMEHEGIHIQYHMGMKMKDCCNCPFDVHYSIRVLYTYEYELGDEYKFGFFTTNRQEIDIRQICSLQQPRFS